MSDTYQDTYKYLQFDRPHPGVLRIKIASPLKMNALTADAHREVSRVWGDVDGDPSVSVVIITAAGDHFSAGGDLASGKNVGEDYELRAEGLRQTRNIVLGMINCSKPIISAVRGWAVGAGLSCALLADISIFSKTAKLADGHTKIGIAAGDHAAIIWPLLCGMAKTKYYLLTCEQISGEEAERIGLVSLAVEDSELDAKAEAVASRLADGAQSAIRWTKRTLNLWIKQAEPIFEASLAYEYIGLAGPESREAMSAFLEKRHARFQGDVAV